MNDRAKLISLRISVARLAQSRKIELAKLPVLDKDINELHELASTQESGWNTLILEILEQERDKDVNRKFLTDEETLDTTEVL